MKRFQPKNGKQKLVCNAELSPEGKISSMECQVVREIPKEREVKKEIKTYFNGEDTIILTENEERFNVRAPVPTIINVPADYPTIQAAIDYLKSLDDIGYVIVKIAPGTYDEFVEITGIEGVANLLEPGTLSGGYPGFQILGDDRPYICQSYVNGYQWPGQAGRSQAYTVTTNIPGIGPYNALLAATFGGIGGIGPVGAENALPLFAPNVSGIGCGTFGNTTLAGKIALIRRGTCGFAVKTKNAQNAGAAAAIIWNTTAGIPSMGGNDPSVTIPAYAIGNADGLALSAAIEANPSIQITVTPNAGAYDPPLGTNGAMTVLTLNSPNQITVTLTDPLPIADSRIAATPVLEQPNFSNPKIGLVAGDRIALSDSNILGNYRQSLHQITSVVGNAITFTPAIAPGGVDISAPGSSITFLPNVRITKSFPYAPGQLSRPLLLVQNTSVSVSGIWVDQHPSQPFGNISAGIQLYHSAGSWANIAVTDFYATTTGDWAVYLITSQVDIQDGMTATESSVQIAIVGWAQGFANGSYSMVRNGNIFQTGLRSASGGASIGSSYGLNSFRVHGCTGLYQPNTSSALSFGSPNGNYAPAELTTKYLHLTDFYGPALNLYSSRVTVSSPALIVERVYNPVGELNDLYGAVILSPSSRMVVQGGSYYKDTGAPYDLTTPYSLFKDIVDLTPTEGSGFTTTNTALVIQDGASFVSEAEVVFDNVDYEVELIGQGTYSAINDPANENDILRVFNSGPLNPTFNYQELLQSATLITLDPAEMNGLEYRYVGKTFTIYSTDRTPRYFKLSPPARFLGCDRNLIRFNKPGSFIIIKVLSPTSVLIEEKERVSMIKN